MYKFAKIMKELRLFAYITLISFQVQILLDIGNEIIGRTADKTTLYKVVSFVLATFALFCLKAMYEMWSALGQATKDIRALKKKGHLQGVTDPAQSFEEPTAHVPATFRPLTDEEVLNMKLLEQVLRKKGQNEPTN